MTASKQLTDTGSRFSWKRVGMLYAYNRPYLSRELLFYIVAIIVMSGLTLLPIGEIGQFMIFSLVWSIIPYMCNFAPLIFAKGGDSRIVDRMIPARPSEKYLFYLSYILLVIPAVCYTLPLLASWAYLKIPSIQTEFLMELTKLRFSLPIQMIALNVLTTFALPMTCFYTLISSRHNRVLKGVISVFAVQFAMDLIGGIYGFMVALNGGFDDVANHPSATTLAGISTGNFFMQEMASSPFMAVLISIMGVYACIMFRLTYKAVNRKNL